MEIPVFVKESKMNRLYGHFVIFMIAVGLQAVHNYLPNLRQESKYPTNGNDRIDPILSDISGSLNLALQYCHTRALLLNTTRVSRHCIKLWNRNYNEYCVKTSHLANQLKCKRLKRRAAKLHTLWINVRTKSSKQRKQRLFKCGKTRVNRRQYGCCNGKAFELTTEGCCGDQIYNKTTANCCGDQIYNKTTGACCNSVIYIQESQGCCYDTVYSKTNETCCNMKVYYVDGRQNKLCCGNESIDASIYFCIDNGTVIPKDVIRKVNVHYQPTRTTTTTQTTESDALIHIPTLTVTVLASSLIAVLASLLLLFMIKVYNKGAFSRNYLRVPVNKVECPTTSTIAEAETSRATDMLQVDTDLLNNESYMDYKNGRSVSQIILNTLNLTDTESDMVPEQDTCLTPATEMAQSVNRMVPYVTTFTQTYDEKEVNIKNSMGRSFDVQFVFNSNNKTLRIPNSAAIITLSDVDTAVEKTCLASTFRNVYDVTTKLELDEDERVASPAVEYYFVNTSLKGLAKVTLPFIGNPENLTVLKVVSDQGRDAPVQKKVIKQMGDAPRGSDEEYFELLGVGKVAIYVKSLSWLVCTSCNEGHKSFHLAGYLYGRLDVSPAQVQASLGFYIVDEIRIIQDYQQLITDAEEGRRVRLLWRRLPLPQEVALSDSIRVSLAMHPPNMGWGHKTCPTGVIQPETQDIAVHTITSCHRENQSGLPFTKEWYLTAPNRSNQAASHLECILSTAHVSSPSGVVSNQDSHSVQTSMLYEDLARRAPAEEKRLRGDERGFVEAVPPAGHIHQPVSGNEGENRANVGNQVLRHQQPQNEENNGGNQTFDNHQSQNGEGRVGNQTRRNQPPAQGSRGQDRLHSLEESPGNRVRGEIDSPSLQDRRSL